MNIDFSATKTVDDGPSEKNGEESDSESLAGVRNGSDKMDNDKEPSKSQLKEKMKPSVDSSDKNSQKKLPSAAGQNGKEKKKLSEESVSEKAGSNSDFGSELPFKNGNGSNSAKLHKSNSTPLLKEVVPVLEASPSTKKGPLKFNFNPPPLTPIETPNKGPLKSKVAKEKFVNESPSLPKSLPPLSPPLEEKEYVPRNPELRKKREALMDFRKGLPIFECRDKLMEEFKKNRNLVIVGETGPTVVLLSP